MSLTINTTVRGENANSYNEIAGLDSYFEANAIFNAIWTAFSADEKIQFAVLATRGIDRLAYINYKYDIDQALEFPRSGEDSTKIPQKVKDAQAEMLLFIYNDQDSTTSQSGSELSVESVAIFQGVSVKFGGGSSDKRDDKQMTTGGTIEAVQGLLREWLIGTGSAVFDLVR